jgi:hypothetical protein
VGGKSYENDRYDKGAIILLGGLPLAADRLKDKLDHSQLMDEAKSARDSDKLDI